MADKVVTPNPSTPSSDYCVMLPYWDMADCLLGGTEAMRAAGEKYLPKFPKESSPDYALRNGNSKYTNIFSDIVQNLAAKPFAKEITLTTATPEIEGLSEDIDGQGNHINVFAGLFFFQAIVDGIDWIFIDKTPVPDGATKAVEKEIGARPYWIHVPAKRMLAVYSDVIEGKEQFVHARIHEPEMQRVGYEEVYKNRVRILNREQDPNTKAYGPATWALWEEQKDDVAVAGQSQKTKWVLIDQGPIGIGVIALVPLITGRKKERSWIVTPPMRDAAYLQVKHYQYETNLDSVKDQAAFPMLAGNGVEAPKNDDGTPAVMSVGPKTVLFTGRTVEGSGSASFTYVEPAATSMKFLAEDIKNTEQQLRELGRQPLTSQSGNLTVITTAFAAQKGNSAVMAWALNLKDALEQAYVFTGKWLAQDKTTEVQVFTDFGVEVEGDKAPDYLLAMRKNGDLSRKTMLVEGKRRGYLSPEFDEEEDTKALLEEIPGEPTPDEITGAAV